MIEWVDNVPFVCCTNILSERFYPCMNGVFKEHSGLGCLCIIAEDVVTNGDV